ncbi:MAG: hypothetical protein R3Y40_01160 [Eubacteriales bacterium]
MEAVLEYAGLEKESIRFNYHRVEVYAESGKEGQAFISLEDLGVEIK